MVQLDDKWATALNCGVRGGKTGRLLGGEGDGGAEFEHSVEGGQGVASGGFGDGDDVDRRLGGELVEAPEQVRRIDPVHGCAKALNAGQ